jgi:hypothetical protein
MDGADLVELVGGVFRDKQSSALAEDENVVLFFEELSDLLVLFDERLLESVLAPQAQVADIRDQMLPNLV